MSMEALAGRRGFSRAEIRACWVPAPAFRAATLKRVVSGRVAIGAAEHARDGLRD